MIYIGDIYKLLQAVSYISHICTTICTTICTYIFTNEQKPPSLKGYEMFICCKKTKRNKTKPARPLPLTGKKTKRDKRKQNSMCV